MTKLHDETWTAKLEPTFSENDLPLWMVVDANKELVADCTSNEASARLLAQAPAMARLLLKLEWEGREGRCPTCHEGRLEGGHAATCEWVAVLRAAGVLP